MGLNDRIVELVGNDGVHIRFEHLSTMRYQEALYAVLLPLSPDMGDWGMASAEAKGENSANNANNNEAKPKNETPEAKKTDTAESDEDDDDDEDGVVIMRIKTDKDGDYYVLENDMAICEAVFDLFAKEMEEQEKMLESDDEEDGDEDDDE